MAFCMSRFRLSISSGLLAMLALLFSTAHSQACIVTFDLSASFSDGGTASGSVTLDYIAASV
jgi:hypothetical protein